METKANQILDKALPHIPFDGWNMEVLRLAAKEAGLDEAYAEIAFAGGVDDAIKLFLSRIDTEMLARYSERKNSYQGITQNIKGALLCRLDAMQPQREVIRKTVQYLSNPLHSALSLSLSYHTVDQVWRMIGDKSTDFNFYTKRMILAGVYSTTLLYWLKDESEHYSETEAFLDRRLLNVMQIGKARKKFESALSNCLGLFPFKKSG